VRAPIVDHHNRVFSGKGCLVALVGDLIDFHASGEGPRGHETLHQVAVPKLVLNAVGVVWESLLKELLEVVCRQLHLTLATIYDSHGVHSDEATCTLVDAAVVVDRGCDLRSTACTSSCCPWRPSRHTG
jgi:hypothetical protein